LWSLRRSIAKSWSRFETIICSTLFKSMMYGLQREKSHLIPLRVSFLRSVKLPAGIPRSQIIFPTIVLSFFPFFSR
jgi:hypothetical protein